MEDPRGMGLFELARRAYEKRSGLTDAYNQQMAAARISPAVESYMLGQQPQATPDQLSRFEDKMMKENLSTEMYGSYKGENDVPYDEKTRAYIDKFKAASPQQLTEKWNVDLPKPKYTTKAGLMSEYMDLEPNLGAGNKAIVQGLLGMGTGQKPTSLMQNLTAAGYKQGTPEYFQAMKDYLAKAQTQINMGKTGDAIIPVPELMKMRTPNGGRPPIGTTYAQAQRLGLTLEGNISGDAASKLAMLDTAKSGLKDIQAIQFDQEGKINTNAIKQAWTIGVAEPLAGLMKPESGKLFSAYEFGIQAITRAETGAAMPAEEVTNTRKRFMPKPWDSDEVVRQKWKAYQLFINNAAKYIDPAAAKSGNWKGAINFNALMNDAKKPEKTVNFEDM